MCPDDRPAVAFVVKHHVNYKEDGTIDMEQDNSGINSICLVCVDLDKYCNEKLVLKCSAQGSKGEWKTPFADERGEIRKLIKDELNDGQDLPKGDGEVHWGICGQGLSRVYMENQKYQVRFLSRVFT